MNLFEFNDKFRELQKMDDLDPEVLNDTLDSLEMARNEKLDNIAAWVEQLKMQQDWLKKKQSDLREKQSAITNRLNSLMSYLTEAIDDTGYKKIQTDRYELKPRNYRGKTIVTDVNKLPEKYRDYEAYQGMYKVKTADLYQDLKDGEDVPGAKLLPNRKTVIS